ncbi:type II secretion system protein GspL [Rahnella inusitata]|uniref:type II secretion system protein GspL n=1 Tax=Rahnella inusitata TaxID=58169 RepID=UPI0039B0F63B
MLSEQTSATRIYVRTGIHRDEPAWWFRNTSSRPEHTFRLENTLQLAQLSEEAGSQSIGLLLPASQVIFRTVTLPERRVKNLDTLLSYMTEESVAGDVENLHWVVLAQEDKLLHVAGIDENYLKNWLSHFSDAGLEVTEVYADATLLPVNESGWSMVRLEEQWLIRQSPFSACIVEDSWLETYLTIAAPEAVTSYSPTECKRDIIRRANHEHPMILLNRAEPSPSLNLMQGKFAVKKPHSAWTKVLPVIALSSVAVTLFFAFGSQLFLFWQARHYESQLEEQTRAVYTEWFPTQKHEKNLRFYFEQDIKKSPAQFLPTLAKLTKMQSQIPGIEINSLDFKTEEPELTLQVIAPDARSLDNFIELSADQFHFQPFGLTSTAQGVTVTLRNREKK